MTDAEWRCCGCGSLPPFTCACATALAWKPGHESTRRKSEFAIPTAAPTLRDAPMSDAAVEAVARAFCKRMGLDPDRDWSAKPGLHDPLPYWTRFRQDAREAIAMSLAVKEVLG